jgi:hypothetical protein
VPRRPRLHVPGGCYHVILRGNHREDLFATPNDRAALNEVIIDVLQCFDSRIHAFCWMTNHLHALIQIGNRPLGKPGSCINSSVRLDAVREFPMFARDLARCMSLTESENRNLYGTISSGPLPCDSGGRLHGCRR